MGRRRLVNAAEAKVLFGLPADEDSLLRHYTLDPIDRLECEVRRRPHNKLGFAVQLCVIRHTGRLLGEEELPHATVIRYLADQLGVDSQDYAIYARRVQTRFEHSRFLTEHLSLHIANKNDRRASLLAAIDAAAAGDKGYPIVTAVISEFRQRGALLPSQAAIETIGLAGRAIARRRAEITLLEDIAAEKLEALDALLHVDPAIGQTRFHWLRSAPDAPGASNLIGLTERIAFLHTLEIDPQLQARISSGRRDQIIREGDATPVRDNGLTIALVGLFAFSAVGMVWSGYEVHNEELQQHGSEAVGLLAYMKSGDFLSALFENWESEFLQMSAYVVLTAVLFQRGSAESRDPENPDRPDDEVSTIARKYGAAIAWLYSYSLGIALGGLFVISFGLHWWASLAAANEDAVRHGGEVQSLTRYLLNSQLWFESFQNWQSEFMSTAVLVVLSIFLRHKGSPESKPAGASNEDTGA